MQAHANDLRVEVAQQWQTLIETTGGAPPSDPDLDALVHQIVDDWRAAPLSASVKHLLNHAERVTLSPADCTAEDVSELRAAGWSDAAIHDAVQIVSYFNYINRVADALGVDPEPDLPHWGRSTSL